MYFAPIKLAKVVEKIFLKYINGLLIHKPTRDVVSLLKSEGAEPTFVQLSPFPEQTTGGPEELFTLI